MHQLRVAWPYMRPLGKGTMTEQELIKLSKAGQTSATEELYANYKMHIRSLARKYFLVDGDLDDLIQEGTMAFLNAINTYDEQKNNNFKAYVTLVINRKLINKIKSSSSLKNFALNTGYMLNGQGEIELEDKVLALENDSLSPEENTISDENIKDIYTEIEQKLSEYERTILNLYLQGYAYTDIAIKLDKDKKSVDNALNRIKHKLQGLK